MISTTLIDAVLPAAGRISGELAQVTGTHIKALIPLGETTILERTVEALRATRQVGRIVICGPEELHGHAAVRRAAAVLPEAGSGIANIFACLQWQQQHPTAGSKVLIVATDLPFINAAALSGFIDACPADLDMCFPVFQQHEFEARFGATGGTYIPLRDGRWTAGNAFLMAVEPLLRNRAHLESLFAARKSIFGMARLLGPLTVLRFMFRQVGLAEVRQRAEQIMRCTGAPVEGCAAELAYDIDLVEEYRYAVEWMRTHQQNAP